MESHSIIHLGSVEMCLHSAEAEILAIQFVMVAPGSLHFHTVSPRHRFA